MKNKIPAPPAIRARPNPAKRVVSAPVKASCLLGAVGVGTTLVVAVLPASVVAVV